MNGPKSFFDAAIAAFPLDRRAIAVDAARQLAPAIDNTYRKCSICLQVSGDTVYIPERLEFLKGRISAETVGDASPAALCLLTRSTDGHVRQAAVKHILTTREVWTIPFVVLLLGDYAVEIIDEILPALPSLDRAAYSEFVRENRSAMRMLRSKATSYWNAFHRQSYPSPVSYPGLAALRQLETWAS